MNIASNNGNIYMESLSYMTLKAVSRLMADLSVVKNPEFLCCFSQAFVSLVLKMRMHASFSTTYVVWI